ncbi:2,3-dihydro-2,3-dihydroxybenzoate dehydrogenase [Saccharothrix sp. NPDC042600]|uniref:2,3-dihydro-2,3-dihydroxybenzoate dehydrogenase n=1 Tax=Saccharothrix TaxID=2071 RepID=UPI0033FC6ED6|nr:2,3-dihydro-2,3-dihydroxybenzoate dehydrogenase [Saccharothrix mutabilis subsp. capreolus]
MAPRHDVALVTGAAGGIGTGVVRALAAQGRPVAALDLTTGADGPAHDEPGITRYRADVADSAGVAAVVERVERELGGIGLLVNAAGVLRTGAAVEMSDEDWRATFAVNLDGVFHTTRAVAPRMVRRRAGVIVTVGSNAGRVPRMRMAAYGAAKAAVASYTRTLGLELAEHGIRCNVVSPGSTDTPMLRALWTGGDGRRAVIDGAPDQYRLGIPLRRIAEPRDVVEAVLFLASERARHITMQDLCVDGGAILGT